MKVIVPYANDVSDPAVFEALKLNLSLQGIKPEYIRMNELNDYALLINRLWFEAFIIVEHDVLPWRGALQEIWDCESSLCGFDGTLQCIKIIPFGGCPVDKNTSWMYVDKQLLDGLYSRGIMFHDHGERAPVINLNRMNIPL